MYVRSGAEGEKRKRQGKEEEEEGGTGSGSSSAEAWHHRHLLPNLILAIFPEWCVKERASG